MRIKNIFSAIKIAISIVGGIAISLNLMAQTNDWPVLKHYNGEHLLNVALPLGGIGTGTVSLGGRGELRDWEIMNKPGKGFNTVMKGNEAPFFSIFVNPENQKSQTRALLGPMHPSEYLHFEGRPANQHGMPRFKEASFDAAYPFGQVSLVDDDIPVTVKIKGFNPLIPGDIKNSSLPIAVLKYEITNTTDKPLEVSVCGTMRNFVGIDGSETSLSWKGDLQYEGAKKNQNTYKEFGAIKGIYMYSDEVDKKHPAWGSIALVTDTEGDVTYRRSSLKNHWNRAILDFWDDFSEDGILTDKQEVVDDNPMASLAVKKTIGANQTEEFNFYLTWHFPNRYDWNGWFYGHGQEWVGNYYTQQYSDAWDVVTSEVKRMKSLEEQTLIFVNAFLSSTYDDVIKEAALFNAATLRSQTVFRTPEGQFLGWEGIMDNVGSCWGSCTHVWNYETTTAFLFGEMAKNMRLTELKYHVQDDGLMLDRVCLPLEEERRCSGHQNAADGQLGSIMQFYREWQLSGDMDFLKNNYERIKLSMSHAWKDGGWDSNQDGVIEGKQHNTMDCDFYGPNPQIGFWYLGALKSTAVMADAVGDEKMKKQCERIMDDGANWMDENLFNGEYYEHKITNPKTFEFLEMDNPNEHIPDFQLGRGCLVDQLAGQYMSHLCNLGYLADSNNIKTTLSSIMKYNYIDDFTARFNNMRSYAIGDEAGLLVSSWPKGRLKYPFPYFAECWSGLEYTAATGMIYEGQTDDALKCIHSIRDRYDGEKRNPFSEPECGHHYARAMAAWSAHLAISGFNYSGIDKTINFTSTPGTYFWSNGYAWGTFEHTPEHLKLNVLKGELYLNEISLDHKTLKKFNDTKHIVERKSLKIKLN